MKQISKRVSSVLTALLMIAVLMLSNVSAVWASDSEVDESTKQMITSQLGTVTDTIISLGDEDIENYLSQPGNDFTLQAVTAWKDVKDSLGTLKERTGDITFEKSGDGYNVTVPASFEKAEVKFIYKLDGSTLSPTELTVEPEFPLSKAETLRQAVMNTIMGISIVFIVLIFLSFLISLFRFIPNPEAKKKAQAAAPAPAPVAAPVEVQEAADDTELIAVIAAAIAAAEGTTTDGFVVRSIRKINRKTR